jgi:hypothetical protein
MPAVAALADATAGRVNVDELGTMRQLTSLSPASGGPYGLYLPRGAGLAAVRTCSRQPERATGILTVKTGWFGVQREAPTPAGRPSAPCQPCSTSTPSDQALSEVLSALAVVLSAMCWGSAGTAVSRPGRRGRGVTQVAEVRRQGNDEEAAGERLAAAMSS